MNLMSESKIQDPTQPNSSTKCGINLAQARLDFLIHERKERLKTNSLLIGSVAFSSKQVVSRIKFLRMRVSKFPQTVTCKAKTRKGG